MPEMGNTAATKGSRPARRKAAATLAAAPTSLADALFTTTQQRVLALLYGSVAKGTDTATSDIDILIVADGVTLEDIYSALAPVEADLDRKISPTLYTPREFADRKASGNPFLSRVLSGKHLILIDNENEPSAA